MLKHIVIFKYKPEASEDQIQQCTQAFQALKDKIPGIVSFEHGANISQEGLNLGFDHVYVLTFENEKRRDEYLPHPEHKRFGEFLGQVGVVESVFVVDYLPDEERARRGSREKLLAVLNTAPDVEPEQSDKL
jgi:hypothetical protein